MCRCAIVTLGCKVNQCESGALAEMMRENGYEIVGEDDLAEVYIINTCCVTAEGERKSRQAVRRALTINPSAVIAVTGCASQRAPEVFKAIEGVSIVVGNSHKSELPRMLTDKLYGTFCDDMSHFNTYQEMPDFSSERTRAFIKIQDGCNNFCSYCIIPYVRGRECSRLLTDIIRQCENIAEAGYKEIVINGIHLSSYGKEWNYSVDLGDVVKAICEIDGIERVRLGSLEPNIISDAFLKKVTSCEKFCRQYHLSLQSGSNGVLKRMNRKYTAEEFYSAVEKIRNNYPLSAISTDIITGFPQETEEEFNETLAFCNKVGFAWAHVFPYSVREGTVAEKMSGQIEKRVKCERAAILSRLCTEKGMEYRRQFIGKTVAVLCENEKHGKANGLICEHIQVEFEGSELQNRIVNVKITDISENGLIGERM